MGLKGATIFKHLSEDQLTHLMHQAEYSSFSSDDIIVAEGEPGDKLYIITHGIVKIKKVIPNHADKILAYLLPGNTFGELGILDNKPRSATVQALTEVEALCFDRESFIKILHDHPSITIELAKLLGHYLTESNKRLAQGGREKKIVFIIDRFGITGASELSRQLAIKLKHLNEQNTVLAEYPGMTSSQQQDSLTFGSIGRIFHDSGIDILDAYTPESKINMEKLALYVDNLLNHYDNLLILLRNEFAKKPVFALESADQVILLSTHNNKQWEEVVNQQKLIKSKMQGVSSQVLTLMISQGDESTVLSPKPDIQLVRKQKSKKNKVIENNQDGIVASSTIRVAAYLADRLHRDHQIGILIPTTTNKGNLIDSSLQIDNTLNFLGKRFGGATCEEVKGVWNSYESGLIGEKAFKIHTYVSAADLRKHMGEIVDFVRTIKDELQQEAMALEVNHKLTLL